jgi:aspartyl-tRNA(Asn)/glutamyl-tRNA(Gln) amidotransferase subunit C
MTLTLAQVEHIAELAHLSLTDDEKLLYQEQLSSILEYAQRLQELDTDAIPPTATILPVHSIMRTDESILSMHREDLLSNAPASAEGMFLVPIILPT